MYLHRSSNRALFKTAAASAAGVAGAVLLSMFTPGHAAAIAAPIFALPGMFAGIELNDRRIRARWAASIESAVKRFECIHDGLMWRAADAELVHQVDPAPVDEHGRHLVTSFLFKTARAAWFALDVQTVGPQVVHVDFHPLQAAEVADILLRVDRVTYAQYFQPAGEA